MLVVVEVVVPGSGRGSRVVPGSGRDNGTGSGRSSSTW